MISFVITNIVVLWCICSRVAGGPDTTLRWRTCNGEKVGRWSDFAIATGQCLVALKDTPDRESYDYYVTSRFGGGIVFGHGNCNGAISQSSSSDCLRAALDALVPCALSVGAQLVQLEDCRIRYEAYPFNERGWDPPHPCRGSHDGQIMNNK